MKRILLSLLFCIISILMVSAQSTQLIDYQQSFKKGDANGDGAVNVTDIVIIVNNILSIHSDNFNPSAADVNEDGLINVTDIVGVVNIILKGDKEVEAVFYVLKEEQRTANQPFAVGIMEHAAVAGFINEQNEIAFLLFDFIEGNTFIISPTDKGIYYYSFDPTTGLPGNKMLLYQQYSDGNYIGLFDANFTEKRFICDSVIVRNQTASSNLFRSGRRDSMSDYIRSVTERVSRLYDDCSDDTGDVSDAFGIIEHVFPNLPGAGTVSTVAGCFSKIFKGMSRGLRKENFTETAMDIELDNGIDLFAALLENDGMENAEVYKNVLSVVTRHSNSIWDKVKSGYKSLFNSDDSDITDEEASNVTAHTWERNRLTIDLPLIDLTQQPQYRVDDVSVQNITATSAVFYSSCKELRIGQPVYKKGFRITGPGGTEEFTVNDLEAGFTLTGLEPETTYTVCAFVYSTSGDFLSQETTFTTLSDGVVIPMTGTISYSYTDKKWYDGELTYNDDDSFTNNCTGELRKIGNDYYLMAVTVYTEDGPETVDYGCLTQKPSDYVSEEGVTVKYSNYQCTIGENEVKVSFVRTTNFSNSSSQGATTTLSNSTYDILITGLQNETVKFIYSFSEQDSGQGNYITTTTKKVNGKDVTVTETHYWKSEVSQDVTFSMEGQKPDNQQTNISLSDKRSRDVRPIFSTRKVYPLQHLSFCNTVW